MLQVRFEGSETELRKYIRKHRFISSRIILIEDNTAKAASTRKDWKKQWEKVSGMWRNYETVQDDFKVIRQSMNNRIIF